MRNLGVGRVVVLFSLLLATRSALAQAPSPPPQAPPPPVVAPTALEQRRISGERLIVPDDDTKRELEAFGLSRLVATYKICINVAGAVTEVVMLKSSGLPSYDRKLAAGMRTWRYRPYTLEGKAVPVCTSVTFIYQQRQGVPPVRMTLRDSGYGAFFTGRELRDASGSPLYVASLHPGLMPVWTPEGRLPIDGEIHALRISAPGYEIMTWCNATDIAIVVGEPVLLAGKARLVGGNVLSRVPGVRLRGGAPVQVLERDLDAAKVRFVEGDRVAEGWIPARVLTRLFLLSVAPSWAEGPAVALPAGTSLLATPRGQALATLARSDSRGAQRAVALSRSEGHILVGIEGKQWWALGWVPQARLLAAKEAKEGTERAKDPIEAEQVISLASNTPIYAAPGGGGSIGRTFMDVSASVIEVRGEYSRISIWTNVGYLFAWVHGTP